VSNPNENEMQDDLQYIMSDRRGRRFIWALPGICGKGNNGMVIGVPDATAYNLGKLDIVTAIEGIMDLDQFVLMIREAKETKDDNGNRSDNTPTN